MKSILREIMYGRELFQNHHIDLVNRVLTIYVMYPDQPSSTRVKEIPLRWQKRCV